MNSVLPSLVFGDTQDNVLKMNPSHRRNNFKLLRPAFTIKKKIPLQSHKKLKIGIIQKQAPILIGSFQFTNKREMISHVVVPIRNDHHFIILDVFLPTDKRPNG